MNYSFDEITDRSGTHSLKWDVKTGELPMWVADMDFAAAPPIRKALCNRLENGIFGYSVIPDEWAMSYVNWWIRRHNFVMDPDWLIFTTGVVPAISTAVRKLTCPAENVLVQTPCYNIFFNSIRNNGRNILENPLVFKEGRYEMDWPLLEKQLSDPQTSLMLLCNPQNPSGQIWDRETLVRLGDLCAQYHVTVLSDEIHCDIMEPGYSYTPFASASETCKKISVTCISPTKAFNIAGLQTAAVMVPDELLRHKMWRGLNTDEVAEPNAFAMDATIAAFNESEDWLKEMCAYVSDNKKLVTGFLAENFPEIKVSKGEATYLLWLDCSAIRKEKDLCEFIRKDSGLYLSKGGQYGSFCDDFIRWNVACPRSMLFDGMSRFQKSLDAYGRLFF